MLWGGANPMQNLSMFPGIVERTEVDAGPVRVEKTMAEREERIDDPLVTEHVEIERVVKNEPVDGPQPIREEGDTVVVPVVKQVLRIEKEWILTEEIRLTRRFREQPAGESVTTEYEDARVIEQTAPRRGSLGGRVPVFKGKLDHWS